MLLEFRVTNFRSIGEEQVLSLVPTNGQKEYPENILSDGKHASLNAIAIYGANGSGKSNLLRGMDVMRRIILRSAQTSSTSKLPYDPFLLRDGFDGMDTSFEILFITDNSRYRYGFSYNQNKISKEWLFRKITGRETKLFERVDDVIDGVPNRHGVSHSWYRSYPSKKASLNAIMLTDYILRLEPLDAAQATP